MEWILIVLLFLICLGVALLGGMLMIHCINKAVELWDKYVLGNE